MARTAIALLAAIAAVAAAGFGLVALDDRAAPPIVIEDPRPDATVVVAVEGAVASPGVFALPGDARVGDALAAAGGAAPAADLAEVNLARRLRDEDRIVVPILATTATAPPTGTGSTANPPVASLTPPAIGTTAPAAVVDLNSATPRELDVLPGIGPVLAERVVAHRAQNGPFRTVDDLADVQGISDAMVDELRSLVTVGR